MEVSTKQVCEDLVMLAADVKACMLQAADEYGLTPAQFFTLYTILHGGSTMNRVAERLHCDASNVTGIISRLVARDLVVRTESERDRRTKTLELTPAGHKIINDVAESLPKQLGCDELDKTERHMLHAVAAKICSKF